jgi:hypothetical protein|tara:strand:+ start:4860 stop:5327 length:468 start_codon:yes stop_codon:yes gene_type:complete
MMDIYFLFNRETQENIGFSMDPKLITGDILWRKVKVPQTENLMNIKWEGNYSTGKHVKISDSNATVTEYDLLNKFYDRLFRKHGVEDLMRIILNQFIFMDIPQEKQTTEFKNLLTFFGKNKDKLQAEIEYFDKSDEHDYESKDQISDKIGRQFKS